MVQEHQKLEVRKYILTSSILGSICLKSKLRELRQA